MRDQPEKYLKGDHITYNNNNNIEIPRFCQYDSDPALVSNPKSTSLIIKILRIVQSNKDNHDFENI